MSEIVIGIDLGTSNSCAAVYLDGTINVLDNHEGDRITPSYVYFAEDNSVVVGRYAKKMASSARPEYGINEIKRLIGRKFDDRKVQKNLQYISYNVENESDNNEPVIVIKKSKTRITKTPVEVCSLILSKIKADVENKLGRGQGTKAVITVPAYFNILQREATLKAADKAGFTVVKLLNEPTAAAFKFFLKNKHQIKENDYFMVYDLGGGTFDVAVLKQLANNIEIVGVDGDSHLGGHDLDNLILDFACDVLLKKYKIDPKSDKIIMRRLRNKCEEAKTALSNLEETEILLETFDSYQTQIVIDISRKQLEYIASNLIKKTMKIVDNCLKSCNLPKTVIKKIILAGGSTRIPKIQEIISHYFGEDLVDRGLHPDECVAEGAAIQAALLSKNPKQQLDVFKIIDVTPLSLGIKDYVNVMDVHIKRNTPIPVSITVIKVTVVDQQKQMTLSIYEGERTDARKNRHLGHIVLNNLTPAPPRQCVVHITFNIDENGILTVTAQEKHKNNIKDLKIVYTRGHTSDAEVKNAVKDAEDNREEDERFLEFARLKAQLLNYCERVKYTILKKNLMELHKDIYDFCTINRARANKIELNRKTDLDQLFDIVTSKCQNLDLQ